MTLSAEHVADIAHRFDLGDDPVVNGQPARGEQGQVWRVTSSRGTFAVKEMFGAWTEDEVRVAADYQDAVTAAGVHVPRIIRTTDGHVLFDGGDGRPLIRVYAWTDLRDPDPRLDPAEVGRTVAAIHRVHQPDPGPVHPWYTEPVGAAHWDELRAAALEQGAPFAADLERSRDELVALETLHSTPTNLQLCHSDLWADNLRSTPDGAPCVIDWENTGAADPAQELGLVLYEFGGADSDRVRSIYRAYVDAGGPFRIARPSDFWMLAAQLMHITARAVELWVAPDAADEQRRHYAALFGEFIERPLTLALVESMLTAIHD